MSAVLGRHDALEEIRRFLDVVEDGRSRVLLLSGQAGIGKTTLWEAGLRAAEERGFRVVSARPTEVETGLAFAALGDVIRPLLDPVPLELPGPQREALDVALLRVSATSPPQPLGVALAVLEVLREAAARQPLLVAVDDAPWLDEPSVRALDFAVRRLDDDRVGLLIARRSTAPDDPPPAWLTLVPPERLTRIDLGALSIDEIDGLLRSRLGLDLSRPIVARLHRVSGGTPFYALELGRELQARGLPTTMDALTVPRSLDELIGERIATLKSAAGDVALHAAALAQPTVAILEAAIGVGRAGRGLQGCLAAGVLQVGDGRVRFTHPLLAAAAYGRAPQDVLQHVHERLAEVVTEAEERARHLARARVEPDDAVARWIEAGAMVAAGRGAPDAAAELLEEAARLTPSHAFDESVRRRAIAAEQLVAAGDIQLADERYAAIAASVPDGPLRGTILADRGYLALLLGNIDAANALLREAMPMTALNDPHRIEIHSLLAGIGYLSWRDWRAARFHAFTALDLAHASGDAALELRMLGHAATWSHALGRPWRGLMERADALDVRIAEMPTLEHPDLQFARILTLEGRVGDGRRRLEPLIERARAMGDWMSLPRFLAVLAELEFDAGDWVRADEVAAEAQTGLRQTGEGGYLHNVLRIRLALRAARGDVVATHALAAELESLAAASAFRWAQDAVRVDLALLDLSQGDAAIAHERLAGVLAEPGLGRLTPVRWESIVAQDVEALVGLGRPDDARRILDPVERRARRRGIPAALAEVRRVRALILAADGSHAAAVDAAEEAVRTHAELQVPFRTARAWYTLGEVLRRSRQKSASRDAFRASLDLFERLGARLWVERSRSELGRVATRRPAGSPLTDTERQVAELAANGRTNREIAAELFMSVHTVEAHLTRVFRALDVQNRTELGRVVLAGEATADDGGTATQDP